MILECWKNNVWNIIAINSLPDKNLMIIIIIAIICIAIIVIANIVIAIIVIAIIVIAIIVNTIIVIAIIAIVIIIKKLDIYLKKLKDLFRELITSFSFLL